MISHSHLLRQGHPTVRRLATENLKCCALCGALNASNNSECFVCSWSGEFDSRAETIQIAFDQLVDQCPELAEAILDMPLGRLPIWDRVRYWVMEKWLRIRLRRLDVRV